MHTNNDHLTSLEIRIYSMTQAYHHISQWEKNEFKIFSFLLWKDDAQAPFPIYITQLSKLASLFPWAICKCQSSNCTHGCASVVLKTLTFICCHFTWSVLNGRLFYTPLPSSWTLTEIQLLWNPTQSHKFSYRLKEVNAFLPPWFFLWPCWFIWP